MLSSGGIQALMEKLENQFAQSDEKFNQMRFAMASLKATVASLLAKNSWLSVQEAYEKMRHQEKSLRFEMEASGETTAVRHLLMSLTNRAS